LAATEDRHALGEVNDDRAFSLGGIASHAGLFGTSADVWKFLQATLECFHAEPKLKSWLLPQSEQRFFGGWDQPSNPKESSAGEGWPTGVIGHLGYTGTALWWHPPTKVGAVLLTNRIYPSDSIESKAVIKELRREFFSCLWQDKIGSIRGVIQKIS